MRAIIDVSGVGIKEMEIPSTCLEVGYVEVEIMSMPDFNSWPRYAPPKLQPKIVRAVHVGKFENGLPIFKSY